MTVLGGPAAIVNDRPVLMSERIFRKDYNCKCSVENKMLVLSLKEFVAKTLNMAVTGISVELVSRYLDLDLCESDDLSCENCATLKLYLQILNNELKSAQQIIKLLQEDKLNNINLKKRDIPSSQTYADIVANRAKTTNQDNKRGINSTNKLTNKVLPKVKLGKKQHRIVILGDSHAKGMATELKYNLNSDFEVIGLVKPGSTLLNIAKSTYSDIKTLKKVMFVLFGEEPMIQGKMRPPQVYVQCMI
jgi:hypothetical protein